MVFDPLPEGGTPTIEQAAVVSYAGEVVFGLGADRTSTSDLAVLAEGIQAAFDELRAAGLRPDA